MSKEDIIECFLDAKGEDNGFQLTLTNKDIDVIANEIERLNNIINKLEHDFESYELEYLQETYQGSLADFIETELKRIQELKKGSGSNE